MYAPSGRKRCTHSDGPWLAIRDRPSDAVTTPPRTSNFGMSRQKKFVTESGNRQHVRLCRKATADAERPRIGILELFRNRSEPRNRSCTTANRLLAALLAIRRRDDARVFTEGKSTRKRACVALCTGAGAIGDRTSGSPPAHMAVRLEIPASIVWGVRAQQRVYTRRTVRVCHEMAFVIRLRPTATDAPDLQRVFHAYLADERLSVDQGGVRRRVRGQRRGTFPPSRVERTET